MSVTTEIQAGTFCWPELCSANEADSTKFYSRLLGWTFETRHYAEGDYTMFTLGGQGVGGLYQMKEERRHAGVQPHWNSFVAVADVNQCVKKATSLGGKLLGQIQEMEGDRYANLEDPTGVKFSLWQAHKTPHVVRLNEPGALCWTELYTRDPKPASAFYTSLFGWHAEPWKHEGLPVEVTLFRIPGAAQPFAAMVTITAEMTVGPQWVPYIQVQDADGVAHRAAEIGGHIELAPMDIPTVGRMALLSDPQGARFAVIRLLS